jgi:hypothetical protein
MPNGTDEPKYTIFKVSNGPEFLAVSIVDAWVLGTSTIKIVNKSNSDVIFDLISGDNDFPDCNFMQKRGKTKYIDLKQKKATTMMCMMIAFNTLAMRNTVKRI